MDEGDLGNKDNNLSNIFMDEGDLVKKEDN